MKFLYSCAELMFIALAVKLIIFECWHPYCQKKFQEFQSSNIFRKIICFAHSIISELRC